MPDITPAFSVVIAVLNEAENVEAVCDETCAALDGGPPYEIVFVDDGSDDATPAILARLAAARPQVCVVRHPQRCGKSSALRTGAHAARGAWIATLDGDGQNDPTDLPPMIAAALAAGEPQPIVAGIRVRRDDPPSRLVATRIANGFRRRVLDDDCPDTGCGVKVFPRDAFLDLPLFEGQHRFLPALFKMYGHPLINREVKHRARMHGVSKYTNFGRAMVGIGDVLGVIWLKSRTHRPDRVDRL